MQCENIQNPPEFTHFILCVFDFFSSHSIWRWCWPLLRCIVRSATSENKRKTNEKSSSVYRWTTVLCPAKTWSKVVCNAKLRIFFRSFFIWRTLHCEKFIIFAWWDAGIASEFRSLAIAMCTHTHCIIYAFLPLSIVSIKMESTSHPAKSAQWHKLRLNTYILYVNFKLFNQNFVSWGALTKSLWKPLHTLVCNGNCSIQAQTYVLVSRNVLETKYGYVLFVCVFLAGVYGSRFVLRHRSSATRLIWFLSSSFFESVNKNLLRCDKSINVCLVKIYWKCH